MRNHHMIGLAVMAVIAVISFTPDSGAIELIQASHAAELGYAPRTSNAGGIKVTATLQTIPSAAQSWGVEVVMETHTKALDDDMSRSAVLFADSTQLMPLSWAAAPPGGHHRKGILHFKALVPQPRSIELQIRLADDPEPRSFKWLLK